MFLPKPPANTKALEVTTSPLASVNDPLHQSSHSEVVLTISETEQDSYLDVLRSQPILLIASSEEPPSRNSLVFLGVSLAPLLYAFGELAFQSGKHHETHKNADKQQAIEERAYKDIKNYQASSERYAAEAKRLEQERREIEARAEANHPTKPWRDAMKDRPWWAGPEWVPPEKPTDMFPDRLPPKGSGLDKMFKDSAGKWFKDFGTRHFKLGYNAEELRQKAAKYEADKDRLIAKWGAERGDKSHAGPHFGIHPMFQKIDSKGREIPLKQDEINKNLSQHHVKRKMASAKAQEYDRMRRKGRSANARSKKPEVKPLSETWEQEAKVEADERNQATLPFPKPTRSQIRAKAEEDEKYAEIARKAQQEHAEMQKAAAEAKQTTSFWGRKKS